MVRAPTPSLLKFLVFIEMAAIPSQNLQRVGLTGKIVLTKDLEGFF
jgi:hypothetical protein